MPRHRPTAESVEAEYQASSAGVLQDCGTKCSSRDYLRLPSARVPAGMPRQGEGSCAAQVSRCAARADFFRLQLFRGIC